MFPTNSVNVKALNSISLPIEKKIEQVKDVKNDEMEHVNADIVQEAIEAEIANKKATEAKTAYEIAAKVERLRIKEIMDAAIVQEDIKEREDGDSDFKVDGGLGTKKDGMDESTDKEVKEIEKGIEADIKKTPIMPPPPLLRSTTRRLKRAEAVAILAASNSSGNEITVTPKRGSKRIKLTPKALEKIMLQNQNINKK
ncbi:unnamed protein product [Chironomus riparius]|uniref:Uncharacterized protein n=1 Tax=Chironomus riparius TaxID=315576 RepID=A0A9N9WU29_9DIPT|nr:unnamed protein product [Chironomus riparius]